MYRKPAHIGNKIETRSLLDRVVALMADFNAHKIGGNQSSDPEEDQSDEEGGILCGRWRELTTDIVAFVPDSESGLATKIQCIVLLNEMEDTSFQDRIDHSNGPNDEIAWSIIRDLVAARPNLADSGLQPRCSEKL